MRVVSMLFWYYPLAVVTEAAERSEIVDGGAVVKKVYVPVSKFLKFPNRPLLFQMRPLNFTKRVISDLSKRAFVPDNEYRVAVLVENIVTVASSKSVADFIDKPA